MCMCVQFLSRVPLYVTLWTVIRQTPLSMGVFWQEDWSGLPFPPPWDIPNSSTELMSPATPALASRFFTSAPPGKPTRENQSAKGRNEVLIHAITWMHLKRHWAK